MVAIDRAFFSQPTRVCGSRSTQTSRTAAQRILDGLVGDPSRLAPGATAYVSGPHGSRLGAAGVADMSTTGWHWGVGAEGGIVSNAAETATFLTALMRGRLLDPRALTRGSAPQRPPLRHVPARRRPSRTRRPATAVLRRLSARTSRRPPLAPRLRTEQVLPSRFAWSTDPAHTPAAAVKTTERDLHAVRASRLADPATRAFARSARAARSELGRPPTNSPPRSRTGSSRVSDSRGR